MKPTPPPTPLARANAARAQARRLRAEWLQAVTTGVVTCDDLIAHAATEQGRALRKISLRQLILSVDGAGNTTLHNRMQAMISLLGPIPDNANIGWLIDSRSGGRRLLAWLDTQTPRLTPTDGFPYAPFGRTP